MAEGVWVLTDEGHVRMSETDAAKYVKKKEAAESLKNYPPGTLIMNDRAVEPGDYRLPAPQEFVRRPVPVLAARMKEGFLIKSASGVQAGNAGDYLLQNADGSFAMVAGSDFEAAFEPTKKGKQ